MTDNVEIVRRIYESVIHRDVETPFRFYADDIVWTAETARRAMLMPRTVYRGHDGVRAFWRDGLSVFAEIKLEVEDLIEGGGDRVLALVREREIGRASGVSVETTHFALWTFADGMVTRMEIFDDRARAFAAAGVEDPARPE